MLFKKPPKPSLETPLSPQEIENSTTRSGFGDNHAATEDAMLAAHAKHLFAAGIVDDKMVAELSKPRRNVAEVNIKYTTEYLAMHPSYTGKNIHEMPSLEKAIRRQKIKDKAILKQLTDFAAGRIDLHGRPIAGEVDSEQESGDNDKEEKTSSDDMSL